MKDFIDYLKWLFGIRPCEHQNIRCIHGDEIIAKGWQRAACTDCFALFDKLPEYCYYTKDKHESFK